MTPAPESVTVREVTRTRNGGPRVEEIEQRRQTQWADLVAWCGRLPDRPPADWKALVEATVKERWAMRAETGWDICPDCIEDASPFAHCHSCHSDRHRACMECGACLPPSGGMSHGRCETRVDRDYCSNACRQRAYRKRTRATQ